MAYTLLSTSAASAAVKRRPLPEAADEGRVVELGTHDELVELIGEQTRIDLSFNAKTATIINVWQSIEGVSRIDVTDSTVTVLVDDSSQVLPYLFETASQANVDITSVDIQEPNLETVFLHLTGRALGD